MKIARTQQHGFLRLLAITLILSTLPAWAADTWTFTGSMTEPRREHNATLLQNGKVLVVGSGTGSNHRAEIYDPDSGTWAATGQLSGPYYSAPCVLLPNGKVLAVGSTIGDPAGVYDPTTGIWNQTDSYIDYPNTATLLRHGIVLVTGRKVQTVDPYDLYHQCYLYDPNLPYSNWSKTDLFITDRMYYYTATLLDNGKVLVVGGYTSDPLNEKTTAKAELYDPAKGIWEATGPLHTARASHTSTLLPSGKVLVAGGIWENWQSSQTLNNTELYDPATGTWTSSGSMKVPRANHTATLLPDGRVLVAGGVWNSPSAELYDPATGSWSDAASPNVARSWHTATLLPNGNVLVAGGGSLGTVSAELYGSTNVQKSISASAGPGGTISPGGNVQVTYGTNKTFTITPKQGYYIAGVMADGKPVGAVSNYSFNKVIADHTIQASFTTNPHASGTAKWDFPIVSPTGCSPAMGDDGTIYVASNYGLYALNKNGSQKWLYKFGCGLFLSFSSPAIGANGTIYVGNACGSLLSITPGGTKKWIYDTGEVIASTPAFGTDGIIYLTSLSNYNDKIHAVNVDGTSKWAYTIGPYTSSSPAVGADGTIYAGSWDGKLYAVNPNGSSKWTCAIGNVYISSPAIDADGTIYVGAWDGKLYAVEPDGTKKWAFPTGSAIISSPAVGADGTIYVGSCDNNLYAVKPDGTKKWAYLVGDWVMSSPAVGADGTIYVGSHDGKLYAIGADGTPKWAFPTGGSIISSPAIGTDGTIYVGSCDGKLYAIYSNSSGLAKSSWPMFRHDLRHSGNFNTRNLISGLSSIINLLLDNNN